MCKIKLSTYSISGGRSSKGEQRFHQGMKEILVSLQEWDCRSGVNIEFPSLGKVCNVLECRSISLDSAACISMKAELDIVRGFKDQRIKGRVGTKRRNEKQNHLDRIREKNKQLQSLINDLKDVENSNSTLQDEVDNLKTQLRNSTEVLNQASNDHNLIQNRIQSLNDMNKNLVKEGEGILHEGSVRTSG